MKSEILQTAGGCPHCESTRLRVKEVKLRKMVNYKSHNILGYRVQCANCDIMTKVYETRQEAIRVWEGKA